MQCRALSSRIFGLRRRSSNLTYPEKTADIWRPYHCFLRQMTSEKQAQKFHTDDASLNRSGCRVGNLIQPIRSITKILVVTRHQYGISALVTQTSFGGETSGSVAKCRLFSQAKPYLVTLFSIAFCFRGRLPNQDHEFRRQMYCSSALGHCWARKVLIRFSDKIGVHTVACACSYIPVVASLHPKIWRKHSITNTNNLS